MIAWGSRHKDGPPYNNQGDTHEPAIDRIGMLRRVPGSRLHGSERRGKHHQDWRHHLAQRSGRRGDRGQEQDPMAAMNAAAYALTARSPCMTRVSHTIVQRPSRWTNGRMEPSLLAASSYDGMALIATTLARTRGN